MSDKTNPGHYKWHPTGVECIDVTEHFTFNLGNAIKYIWRAGRKDSETALQDLNKAEWYLQREKERIEAKKEQPTVEHPMPLTRNSFPTKVNIVKLK